jgi:hypothetical protein
MLWRMWGIAQPTNLELCDLLPAESGPPQVLSPLWHGSLSRAGPSFPFPGRHQPLGG